MSVELEPPELGFKRPFQHEVSQTLRLRNPHPDPVAFKVKTTAPKQYCVRPNSGRIEPGKAVEVQVLLQAMKEDPPLEAKCRDKFLVQSVAVAADKEFSNVASIWSHIEQTNKASIQEKKIRVNFLPADDATATTPKSNGVSHRDDSSILSSPSPEQEAVTPQRYSTTAPVGPVSRPESRPADSKHLGDAKASVFNLATEKQSTVGATVAAVAKVLPTSAADVEAQLAEAKATIGRLRKQMEDQTSGLRQRKAEATEGEPKEFVTTQMGVQHAPAGGVPVPIVALLCLLSFLMAYFFF